MIDYFQPTNPFAAQTQRLAAEAQLGGGDLFDIDRLCRNLEPGDSEAWQAAWLQLAEATEGRADAAFAQGNDHTAAHHAFCANQYYRQSEIFMAPGDKRKRQRFVKARNCFRAAAAVQTPAIEVVQIASGGETYDGYFCLPGAPAAAAMPVVIMIGGADAYAEENYFSGRRILDRGWAMLLVDTPGRGSSFYIKDILTRPDYEVPIAACIDYLQDRGDVDPDRLVLLGISMGGFYVARAAAFEKRLRALICWCGCYSILEDLFDFFAPLRPTLQSLVGAATEAAARAHLSAYSMEGLAANITCPTLISHGAQDLLMNVEGAKRLFEEIGSDDKTLKIWDGTEGGTGHCSYDNWPTSIPYMLDWLKTRI
jgi:dienelactone hydrolase